MESMDKKLIKGMKNEIIELEAQVDELLFEKKELQKANVELVSKLDSTHLALEQAEAQGRIDESIIKNKIDLIFDILAKLEKTKEELYTSELENERCKKLLRIYCETEKRNELELNEINKDVDMFKYFVTLLLEKVKTK